jgi:hypothetical protein
MGTQQDFLPSSWHQYIPTIVDFGILLGTICFFLFLFLLFIRWVPFVPVFEVKELKAELEHEERHALHGHPHEHNPEEHGVHVESLQSDDPDERDTEKEDA